MASGEQQQDVALMRVQAVEERVHRETAASIDA
jgi:hypothetical protein